MVPQGRGPRRQARDGTPPHGRLCSSTRPRRTPSSPPSSPSFKSRQTTPTDDRDEADAKEATRATGTTLTLVLCERATSSTTLEWASARGTAPAEPVAANTRRARPDAEVRSAEPLDRTIIDTVRAVPDRGECSRSVRQRWGRGVQTLSVAGGHYAASTAEGRVSRPAAQRRKERSPRTRPAEGEAGAGG